MTDTNDWPTCPACASDNVDTADDPLMHCDDCDHEWTTERASLLRGQG